MSIHTHHHMIQGPFRSSDPLADLITYFEVNGYSVSSQRLGELPSGFTVMEVENTEPSDAESRDAEEVESEEVESEEVESEEVESEEVESEGVESEEVESEEVESEEVESEEVESEEVESEDKAGAEVESVQGDEGVVSVKLTRGKKNASLWSSDMSELLAEVRIEALNSGIKVSYEIVITGQHLTEEDLAFWRREATNAEKFVCGKVDSAIDWRTNENIRIERQQRDIFFIGIKAMILTMVLVFFGYQMAC